MDNAISKLSGSPIKVYNARQLQANYSSPRECFEKHGFCLLYAPTKVKNWNENYFNPFTDITKHYHGEIK